MSYRILVVDDETDLCDILQFNLENEGYRVDTANSAEEALQLDLTRYDLILLDVMMGEISGFKMAKLLKQRPETAGVPVIFLTARDTENDTVTGFTMGADDYIAKPFSIREVMLRVKAVLRRTASSHGDATSTIGYQDLVIDTEKKIAILRGERLQLTKTEFELLRLLVENEGKVFSRADVLKRVWQDDVCVLDRTVDVNITRLRRKLNDYGKCVVTRQGFGYCFDATVL